MATGIVFVFTYSKNDSQSLRNQFQFVTNFQEYSEAREHHATDFIKAGFGKPMIF